MTVASLGLWWTDRFCFCLSHGEPRGTYGSLLDTAKFWFFLDAAAENPSVFVKTTRKYGSLAGSRKCIARPGAIYTRSFHFESKMPNIHRVRVDHTDAAGMSGVSAICDATIFAHFWGANRERAESSMWRAGGGGGAKRPRLSFG